ncbi:MAG TPA: 4a-hydroxytetrahydrobiopterin dehydratase [bacterium]|jgi:4a-hydroxytetrahydrobiopterin dehydratase|nr:4a-hydroxytetrahydrobiopterin dehydratase [bacterium]
MDKDLASRHCVPCEGGTPPLGREAAERLRLQTPDWVFEEDGKAVRRQFKLKDFKDAIAFVNAVAEVAEAEDHHPDIFIRYKQVTFTLSTHAIGGLSENDFILAAKIDRLYQERYAGASPAPASA